MAKREDLKIEYPIDWRGNSPKTATRPVEDGEALTLLLIDPCKRCGGWGRVTDPDASEREYLEGLNEQRCDKCGGDGYRLKPWVRRLQVIDGGSKPDPWTGEAVQAEPVLAAPWIEQTRCMAQVGEYLVVPMSRLVYSGYLRQKGGET